MQSMESAPRDGTRILIKSNISHYLKGPPHYGYQVVGTEWLECWYVDGKFIKWCGTETSRSTGSIDPLGWAPVPLNEAPRPIVLSEDVREALQDLINGATQCEEEDVDHDFAMQLGQLLGPVYASPPDETQVVGMVDESDDGLFIELVYGADGNPLRRGDAVYAHPQRDSELLARVAKLESALSALVRDSMASDFNEHWDSFKSAETVLAQGKEHD